MEKYIARLFLTTYYYYYYYYNCFTALWILSGTTQVPET